MDKFPKRVIMTGCCIVGITLALGWGGVTLMIKGQIKKEYRLINKTDTFQAWKDFPFPMYLSIYLFNITNGAEVESKGTKPILTEVGPYVYLEKLNKADISQNHTSEIYTYRQIKHYFFQPQLSKGTEEDMVTIPNVALLSIAKIATDAKDGSDVIKLLNKIMSGKEDTLLRTHKVKNLLFDGFPIEQYVSLDTGAYEDEMDASNDANLDQEPETEVTTLHRDNLEKFRYPRSFARETYGLFKDRNGSDTGVFEVENGKNLTYLFTQIVRYEGHNETVWWKGECDEVHGSDGLSFHPFINTTSPLYTFEPDYCRVLRYDFNGTEMVNDVESLRFTLAPHTFQGSQKYPENECYCPKENSARCHRNGIYDLAPCYFRVPLLLSKPHFLEADEEIINGVEGMKPDPEKHETFMEMHSLSGVALKIMKRFQFNIELVKYPELEFTSCFEKPIVVPVYWYEESVEAGALHFLAFRIIAMIQAGWNLIKYGLLGGGLVILLLGVVMALLRKNTDPDKVLLVK